MPGAATYSTNQSEQNWIALLKQDGNKALKDIYVAYRTECLSWLQKTYNIDQELAKDTFQLSIVLLYENVISGKLTDAKSSLKSYLFGIAKNKVRDLIKSEISYEKSKKIAVLKESLVDNIHDKNQLNELLTVIRSALTNLGEPCKTILEAFYFERKSYNEIAQIVGHGQAGTTKSKKHKCLKRLQKVISNVDLSNMQYE